MRVRAYQCLFCIFIVGLVMLCGFRQRQEAIQTVKTLALPDEEKAFENVLCSCVRIQGEDRYGSGTIYRITDGQMVIVTNKHVLQYFGENSYITFFDGACAEGEVLYLSKDYDLGFLVVESDGFDKEKQTSYRAAACKPEVYHKLEKNDCIFMIDIATDITKPGKYSGEVMNPMKYLEDYGQEMFYGDAYAKEGMSGCGIFDSYGHYLALLSGGTPYNEIAAVPLYVIEAEYDKIK